MFKQKLLKEERTHKLELAKRDDDLIRKLISRLFGLNFAVLHTAKA